MRRTGLTVLLLCSLAVMFLAPSGAFAQAERDTYDPIVRELMTLRDDAEYARAESLARASLAALETEYGAESRHVAAALNVLVFSLIQQGKGRTEETLSLARRTFACVERDRGPDDRDLAWGMSILAAAHQERQEFEQARPLLTEAIEVLEGSLGPEHLMVAESVGALAGLLRDMGKISQAKPLFARQLAILEKSLGPESEQLARYLYNYSLFLVSAGYFTEAESVYRRTLAIARKHYGDRHFLVAYVLNGMGALFDETGQFPDARSCYTEALDIARETMGDDHSFVASCLNNLGYLYRNLGEYALAEESYQEALDLHQNSTGETHTYTASTLSNLAEIHHLTGRTEQADALYRKAQSIREEVLGPDHFEVATGLETRGALALEVGRVDSAAAFYDRALAIREAALGPDHPDVAVPLIGLARSFVETGRTGEAEKLLRRANALRKNTLGEDHPFVAEALLELALVLNFQNKTSEALEKALEAEAVSRRHLQLTAGALPENQALRYAAIRTRGLDLALSLCSRLDDEDIPSRLWDAVIRSRALVLDEMVRRNQSLRLVGDPETAGLSEKLAEASRYLANLTVRGPDLDAPAAFEQELKRAKLVREQAELALAEKSLAFREQRAERSIGLAQVRASLPPGATLVAFTSFVNPTASGSTGEAEYLAFVNAHGAKRVETVSLGQARDIDGLIQEWSEELQAGPLDPSRSMSERETALRRKGDRVRERIWDPIVAHSGESRSIFIVPEAMLHLVNFCTLPVGNSEYLIDSEFLLHYLSAERDLISLGEAGMSGSGLLAVGGVDFDDSIDLSTPAPVEVYRGRRSDCEEFRSLVFEHLPGSKLETEEIAARWNRERPEESVVLLAGRDADEGSVKSKLGGHRVIHLSTHGFFLHQGCSSKVRGWRGIGGVSPRVSPAPRTENPLRLSGLALAGANQRSEIPPDQEDGILTAEEIGALDLLGTEWVVLSACRTGVGSIEAGEGVLGLRRAFRTAGARTLIMSLWPVEDEAARTWMNALYEARLSRKAPTAEAVKEATVAVLSERRRRGDDTHPFYWGAFVAAGDWR